MYLQNIKCNWTRDPELKSKKRRKGIKISGPVPNPGRNIEYDLF